jgi:putative endonuclease
VATRRRDLGAAGESLVARWYEDAGYRVLDRNWRCREGELDLVLAGRGRVVVFCEVKTRATNTFGTPAEAVTARKQQRLRVLAVRWLDAHPGSRGRLRFDVASVTRAPNGKLDVEVLEDAF